MAAPEKGTMNLAARMGRWSAQHRKKAIWGWLVLVFLAFAIGGAVGTKTQDAAQSGVGESGSAERTIDNAFPKHQVEQVLIQSESSTATDHPSAASSTALSAVWRRFRIRRRSRAPTHRATRGRSRLTGTPP